MLLNKLCDSYIVVVTIIMYMCFSSCTILNFMTFTYGSPVMLAFYMKFVVFFYQKVAGFSALPFIVRKEMCLSTHCISILHVQKIVNLSHNHFTVKYGVTMNKINKHID